MIKMFKLFETRSAGLSEVEFQKLLFENCKDFINNPKLLQRNKIRNDGDFSFINPSVNTRVALKDLDDGVFSEHNSLLMDNLPSWQGFPKRSKSLIGLTNEDSRNIFGKFRYLVIPYDNAKFGVAPSMDIWSCKSKIKIEDFTAEISFNDKLSEALSSNRRTHKITDESYEQMMSDIEILYNNWVDGKEENLGYNPLYRIFQYLSEYNLGVREGFNKILAPDKFEGTSLDNLSGFNIMNYNQISNLGEDDNYEFWTESKCLLYLMDLQDSNSFYDIKNGISQSFEKFCKEYL